MMTNTQENFLLRLEEHKKILFKVANAYCGNATERADLEQEIVAQLWRSFARYDDRYRFSTWMYRVALNVAISFSRSAARRNRTLLPADDALLEMQPAPPGSAEREEEVRRLYGAISRLGDLDRALILLHLDGHRHQDIAEILGITESNVGTKIGRLKRRLRDLLQSENPT